jgi:hypothetical protein
VGREAEMNVFRLLIVAVLAGVTMYFIVSLMSPILRPQTIAARAVENILIDAQADVGHSATVSLTLQKDQSLFARNYDQPTRSVSFECAGEECCPFLENCPSAIGSTPERILTFETTDISLTARCENTNVNIHACKVYAGEEPAQVKLENVQLSAETLSTSDEITFSGSVRNTGKVSSGIVTLRVEIWGKTFVSGKEEDTLVGEKEQTLEMIDAEKARPFSIQTRILAPGEYHARIIARGEDAGMDERVHAIMVIGEIISTCVTDLSQAFEKTYDSFEEVCREKRFCTGCMFAYECRNAWESISTIPAGSYYDTQRGENGFTYLITPPLEIGTC